VRSIESDELNFMRRSCKRFVNQAAIDSHGLRGIVDVGTGGREARARGI
jgi:hypothetical protein